ncbi:MAG: hypothetical protein M3P06_06875 [Acidobacteriota bacterium]|nr:hypothetical protein [Acidobacteriota bacterium]
MAVDNWFEGVHDADPAEHELLSAAAVAHLAAGVGIDGVRVLDYGQGDCSAIVDDAGEPVVFFDMGGGKQPAGSQTHPWHVEWGVDKKFAGAPWRHKIPDVRHRPTVILSHWDGDHYSTAYYLTHRQMKTKVVPNDAPDVTDLKWLVPRQCRHPSKLAFVIELNDVACWPANVERHRFQLSARTFVQVERCVGAIGQKYDPNLDGLALLVERVDAGGDVVERMLLPGDAPYAYIPSCRDGHLDKVVAMLAPHHGSKTHLDEAEESIPAASGEGRDIVYTYGLKSNGERCYEHPSAEAIEAYRKHGWERAQHPAGAFAHWPPGPDDLGDPIGRDDVLLTFSAPDPPDPAVAVRPPQRRPIALRG